MHRRWIPLGLALASSLAAGRGQRGASAREVLEQAPQALATITAGDLGAHAKTLASADYEGRMTGTRGQRKAAEYFAKHFKKLGLRPLGDKKGRNRTFFQSWPIEVEGYDERKTGLFAGSKRLTEHGAIFVPRAMRRKKRIAVKGRLVFAGRGAVEESALGGTIAVIVFDSPGEARRVAARAIG